MIWFWFGFHKKKKNGTWNPVLGLVPQNNKFQFWFRFRKFHSEREKKNRKRKKRVDLRSRYFEELGCGLGLGCCTSLAREAASPTGKLLPLRSPTTFPSAAAASCVASAPKSKAFTSSDVQTTAI